MNQEERRLYLIKELLKEDVRYKDIKIPKDELNQKNLLRSLFNVRAPKEVSEEFKTIQDAYLKEETKNKGITYLYNLTPIYKNIYLWQGDITTLACDAIVNAANNELLGCFIPLHNCIDNQIHTYAGVELRLECAKIRERLGTIEETGKAKITKGYNLPSKYVIHTVGPIIYNEVTNKDRYLLESCYKSCLELASSYNLKSLAFCCISTGEFRFPQEEAAKIAINTVKRYLKENSNDMEVIFNVFKDRDYFIYKSLLKSN